MNKRLTVFIVVLIAYAFVWSWSRSSNDNSSNSVIQQMNQKAAQGEEQHPMYAYLGEFAGTVVPFLLLWWLVDRAIVKWFIFLVIISITAPGYSTEPCTAVTLGRGNCTYSTDPVVFKHQLRWVQEMQMLSDLRLRQRHLTDVLATLRRAAVASDNPSPKETTASADIIEKELEFLNAWVGLVNTWQKEDKKALVFPHAHN
jgi:hypothetical protein